MYFFLEKKHFSHGLQNYRTGPPEHFPSYECVVGSTLTVPSPACILTVFMVYGTDAKHLKI